MSIDHILKVRVYYEDTDAGGVVYHAAYLKFAERGRTEMLRDSGYPHNDMIAETGSMFVVRRIETDYLAPALHDNLLEVRTSVGKVGKTSVVLKQSIMRDEKILNDMLVTLVCVNQNGRATRIPEKALELFEKAI